MNSRYDMMPTGATIDSQDGQAYPDTLQINYNNFKYRQPPYKVVPNDQLQNAPYIFTNSYYGTTDYDDVILNINGVLQLSLLYNNTVIQFPTKSDLITFMKSIRG